jgi:hypothetical protein
MKDWIKKNLVNTKGKPVPNVRYRITPPDSAQYESRRNEREEGGFYQLGPCDCKISFPIWTQMLGGNFA